MKRLVQTAERKFKKLENSGDLDALIAQSGEVLDLMVANKVPRNKAMTKALEVAKAAFIDAYCDVKVMERVAHNERAKK